MRQRATSPEGRQIREAALLEAAEALLNEQSYATITVQTIAERAGLAKGTVYLYFATREALFLRLEQHQLAAWFDALDLELAALDGPVAPAAAAALVWRTLEARPLMLELLMILHGVLEHNVTLEQGREFKYFLRTHVVRSGALFERCLPWLSSGEGAQLLMQLYTLLIGLRQLAAPPPNLAELYADPALDLFRIEFGPAFTDLATLLLLGWQQRHKENL